MENQPVRVKSKLTVVGTEEVNNKAEADLKIPDPDKNRAKAILKHILDGEDEENQSENIEEGPIDNP